MKMFPPTSPIVVGTDVQAQHSHLQTLSDSEDIADASESHDVTGIGTVSQEGVESALDALGVKVNAVIAALGLDS